MQCVTAVEAVWLADMGPMFYSVKEAGAGRSQKRRQAQETMSKMEGEMKIAQQQMVIKKEEQLKMEIASQRRSVVVFYWVLRSWIEAHLIRIQINHDNTDCVIQIFYKLEMS